MLEVLAALLPGILALAWQFGPGVLIQCLIALAFAALSEAAALRLRGRPVLPALGDGSAALAAVLLALCLPPLAPWWIAALGAAFAILLGKQVYGGLGFNPFNPAMAGYAMLLVSFPRPMTAWLPPAGLNAMPLDFAAAWAAIFSRELPAGLSFDALARATPLDVQKTALRQGLSLDQIHAADIFGAVGGTGWASVNLGFLLGGLWLLRRRLIAWPIAGGFLGALAAGSLVLFLSDPAAHAHPLFHGFSGATMLGAFFIATDPVTAATTPRGRWLYGAGIGSLVLLIREFGNYPDGVAFAVLLLNLAAPTLDRYTRPRIFGTAE
jgi:electron transport complex protein RnfD